MRFETNLKLASNERFAQYLKGEPIAPINIEISPAGACNARCSWCFYSTKTRGNIETNRLIKLLDEVKDLGVKAVTWTGGGDPSMHPDLDKIAKHAKSIGLKQGLITNGLLVRYDPTSFDWIRVSKTERGWPENNLMRLREAKVLGMCINYLGDQSEVKKSEELADRIGVDYLQVRPALNLFGALTEIEPPIPTSKRTVISNYKFDQAKRLRGYSSCEGFHFVPFIWEDGEVNVCAYQRGKEGYVLGNINDEPLEDIIARFPDSVPVRADCQVCCKNHEINKLIAEARRLEDVDFV